MRILPVVGRELRAIARRPSAYWVRSGAALLAFIAMAYVAMIGAVGLPTGGQGRSLFNLLSLGAFGFCAVAGIRGTSDVLSQEKREGTLGLLFLTDLKGYDVVLGKLLSVSVNSLYGILAIAPPLALAFMLGGTSLVQFLMMIVFLLNTLFFSLSVGIFISTFSQQERPAMGGTLAIIFVILVMPYAIATAHTSDIFDIWQVMDPGFLLASPIFAFTTIKDATLLRIEFDEVLLSIAFAHLAGWLCLVVAGASVAQRAHMDAPRGKFLTWFAKLRQQWAYGKAERRRAIRGALLDRNAFAWLAGRDRLKQRYAWIFLGLLAVLWRFIRWKTPEMLEEWPFSLFSLWFLHLFFKIWVTSEVAARFIEDRRTNALELLLTTPLKLREFVAGERLALFRQFGAPIALIVIANLFAASHATESTSFLIRSPAPRLFFGAGLVHLAADLYAIHWIAIWRSLHLRGANRTITQTIFLVVLLPVGIWFVMWQVSWLPISGEIVGRTAEDILFRWTVLCVIYDLALAAIARNAFFRDFREAATKSFDKPAPFRWRLGRRPSAPRTSEIVVPNASRPIFTRARKAAVVFAILLVGFNVIVAMRRFRLDRELSARIVQARASGLPFTQSEVARWRPFVNPDDSGAIILRRATRICFSASRHPPELIDMVAHWNSREMLAPDLKRQLGVWVRSNGELFATLEQLRARKPGGAPPDERMRYGVTTDEIARALQTKARLELEDDRSAAAQTVSLMLHYARVLEGEHVQAFVGGRKALQDASELMQRAAIQGGFPAENWREWKRILAQLDFVKSLREMLVAERADGFEMFSLPVDNLYQRFGRQFSDFPVMFSVSWSIRRYFGQDKVEKIEYLDYMNQSISDSTLPFGRVQQLRTWRQPSLASATFIAPQILPAFDWLFGITTEMVAQQRILMTVCDIEIYRTEHGKPPDDLSVLGPVQIDPFKSEPLRYIHHGDEYSVYSLGADMTDNGGRQASGRAFGDIAFHCGAAPERKRTIKFP